MISSIKLFNNKVKGPVPKKSKIWDRSHVMRDRSHLDGIGTPRTHSYHEIYYAIHYEYASHVQKSGVELWSICMIILKLRET